MWFSETKLAKTAILGIRKYCIVCLFCHIIQRFGFLQVHLVRSVIDRLKRIKSLTSERPRIGRGRLPRRGQWGSLTGSLITFGKMDEYSRMWFILLEDALHPRIVRVCVISYSWVKSFINHQWCEPETKTDIYMFKACRCRKWIRVELLASNWGRWSAFSRSWSVLICISVKVKFSGHWRSRSKRVTRHFLCKNYLVQPKVHWVTTLFVIISRRSTPWSV